MGFSERLTKMLIRHEGLRLKPYRDTRGKLTIGIGRNLDDVGITRDEAFYMLKNDIVRATRITNCCCEKYGINPILLPEDVHLVLTDMAFNMGSALEGFKRMFACIKKGDYEGAARELLDSRYAKQVGKRAQELAEMLRNLG